MSTAALPAEAICKTNPFHANTQSHILDSWWIASSQLSHSYTQLWLQLLLAGPCWPSLPHPASGRWKRSSQAATRPLLLLAQRAWARQAPWGWHSQGQRQRLQTKSSLTPPKLPGTLLEVIQTLHSSPWGSDCPSLVLLCSIPIPCQDCLSRLFHKHELCNPHPAVTSQLQPQPEVTSHCTQPPSPGICLIPGITVRASLGLGHSSSAWPAWTGGHSFKQTREKMRRSSRGWLVPWQGVRLQNCVTALWSGLCPRQTGQKIRGSLSYCPHLHRDTKYTHSSSCQHLCQAAGSTATQGLCLCNHLPAWSMLLLSWQSSCSSQAAICCGIWCSSIRCLLAQVLHTDITSIPNLNSSQTLSDFYSSALQSCCPHYLIQLQNGFSQNCNTNLLKTSPRPCELLSGILKWNLDPILNWNPIWSWPALCKRIDLIRRQERARSNSHLYFCSQADTPIWAPAWKVQQGFTAVVDSAASTWCFCLHWDKQMQTAVLQEQWASK